MATTMVFIQGHIPVIDLIKDGLFHLENVIFSEEASLEMKLLLIKLFTTSYLLLSLMCKNNQYVQNEIYDELPHLKRYSYLDVGQTDLMCAVYENNPEILRRFNQAQMFEMFDIIEKEGRQERFLDLFMIVQKFKYADGCDSTEYLLENQTIVLSELLNKIIDSTDREVKILYGAFEQKKFEFALEDSYNPQDKSKLYWRLYTERYQFTDTYLDQPFVYQIKLIDVPPTTCPLPLT